MKAENRMLGDVLNGTRLLEIPFFKEPMFGKKTNGKE